MWGGQKLAFQLGLAFCGSNIEQHRPGLVHFKDDGSRRTQRRKRCDNNRNKGEDNRSYVNSVHKI